MHTRKHAGIGLLLAAATTMLVACTNGGQPAGPLGGGAENSGAFQRSEDGSGGGPGNTSAGETTPAGSIVWKRARVLEQDLMRGLSLSRGELCTELDAIGRVEAHLAPLGGNEPFERAQYVAVPEPSSMSPLVLERLVMGACAKRVALDQGGDAKVFTHFDLSQAPRPDDDDFVRALDAQHRALFQRLLSRNPAPEELEVMRELARGKAAPTTGAALSTLGCFIVGTHPEFAFL